MSIMTTYFDAGSRPEKETRNVGNIRLQTRRKNWTLFDKVSSFDIHVYALSVAWENHWLENFEELASTLFYFRKKCEGKTTAILPLLFQRLLLLLLLLCLCFYLVLIIQMVCRKNCVIFTVELKAINMVNLQRLSMLNDSGSNDQMASRMCKTYLEYIWSKVEIKILFCARHKMHTFCNENAVFCCKAWRTNVLRTSKSFNSKLMQISGNW